MRTNTALCFKIGKEGEKLSRRGRSYYDWKKRSTINQSQSCKIIM